MDAPILSQPVLMAARQNDAEVLAKKIAGETSGHIRDLRVEMVGDYVVLWGRTSTYYMKQLATRIAQDEIGDCELQNSIEVT